MTENRTGSGFAGTPFPRQDPPVRRDTNWPSLAPGIVWSDLLREIDEYWKARERGYVEEEAA